jgi:hypothetical protein
MSNISSLLGAARDLWSRAAEKATPGAAAAPTAAELTTPGPSRAQVDASLDRLVPATAGLEAVVARMDPVGQKLDQVKAEASGPYTVRGATVYSGAQFRMVNGYNQSAANDAQVKKALTEVATRVGLGSRVWQLQNGTAELRDIVRVTQALIDAGYLHDRGNQSVADQIHDLQWRFGVGLDCAAYVYHAVAAVHGSGARLGLQALGDESFTGLPHNPSWNRVNPAGVQAGDVMVLAGSGASHGDPGHNLIVRSHCTLSPPGEAVTSRWPAAAEIFSKAAATDPMSLPRTVHMFEVDSSFGAHSGGDPDGGVRRDVLLWIEGTSTWCTCTSTEPPRAEFNDVARTHAPYGEAGLTGFFRPRGVP